jgi:hypothetical protein
MEGDDDVDGVRVGGSHRRVFSRAVDAVAALRVGYLTAVVLNPTRRR